MKTYILIGICCLTVAAGIYAIAASSATTNSLTWPSGTVSSDSLTYDWGKINIRGGEVDHTFTLTNDSDEPLEIQTASTSCMCTTAMIEITDRTSPAFGMHNNPQHWNGIVGAGESFTVTVTFDPMAHGPDAVGPIQRSVYITTSATPDGIFTTPAEHSSSGSEIELRLTGDVMYKEAYQEWQSSNMPNTDIEEESFDFTETEYDFGSVLQSGGIASHEFPFTYTGAVPITISQAVGSCACTTGSVDPTQLSPGDSGVLTVSFDPNLHEEPTGRFFKTVALVTDPTMDVSPEVKIWADIELDLGPEAYKLQGVHDDD